MCPVCVSFIITSFTFIDVSRSQFFGSYNKALSCDILNLLQGKSIPPESSILSCPGSVSKPSSQDFSFSSPIAVTAQKSQAEEPKQVSLSLTTFTWHLQNFNLDQLIKC